jgi:curved DNA-binding protein CbpA
MTMARPLDPWRTLELPRDATLDEVKAAYRRLAKRYHPDSAGEAALARFLAVQAAYEALTEGPARLRLGPSGRTPRPAPTRSSRPSAGPAPRAPGGATRSSARTDAAGARSGPGTRTGGRGSPGDSTSRRGASRKRAKPGSTSYDDAQFEPFEPSWEGASWYGESSGTYWTLNPKEFADPRKHGPEYQARARSARAGRVRGSAQGGAEGESDQDEESRDREPDGGPGAPGRPRAGRVTDDDVGAAAMPGEGWPSPAAGRASGWAGPGWSAAGGRARSGATGGLGSSPSPGRYVADRNWASGSAGELVALGLLGLGVATLVFVLLGSPVIAGLEPTVAAGGLASIVVALIVRGLASRHSPG